MRKFFGRIVRYIFNVSIRDHNRVSELLPELLGCDFHNYLNMRLLLHFYKVINYLLPITVVENFRFNHSTRNVQTEIPRIYLSIYERSTVCDSKNEMEIIM